MKNILIIILLTASTCLVRAQSSQISISDQEKSFSNKNLTPEMVEAFEARAIQKVYDFNNYIEFVANKEISLTLRAHSKKTAVSLFKSTSCTISDSLICPGVENLTIDRFFDSLLNIQYFNVTGTIENLKISKKLTKKSDGMYSGTISYTQILKFYNKKNGVLKSESEDKKIDIILTRTVKKFGENEKIVWNIYLCDVY